MPRASRYLQPGYTYHLTHRCHDRRFLLKFACDRDAYRRWLYEAAKRYAVPVYGFCITSNHVHIVAHVDETERVGLMMHLVAGAFAQQRHRRKGNEGSVWEHPYHCTAIQDGAHLLNCLRYVSMNMVRAGVVTHPREWRWCSHDEMLGRRSRYRLLDVDRLLESLDIADLKALQGVYEHGIEEDIACGQLQRCADWTDAVAVGDRPFVESAAGQLKHRRQFSYAAATGTTGAWTVKEDAMPYSSETGLDS